MRRTLRIPQSPLLQLSHTQRRASSDQANPSFTYRLAAAASKKSQFPRRPKLNRDYFLYTSVHTDKQSSPFLHSYKRQSGEDAFFVSIIGGSKHRVAFGVADGVGGWNDQGVDPSHFSQGLCGLMAGTAYSWRTTGSTIEKALSPQGLLQKAYDAVLAQPDIVAGSSTACLGVVDDAGYLETTNLGDSGYLIISPGRITFRSAAQTHAFNTPYQLAKIPPTYQTQYSIFGGALQYSETPSQADLDRHKLSHGDIVIFATDGVWDNLSAQNILQLVTVIMERYGYWSFSNGADGAETVLNHNHVSAIPWEIEHSRGVESSFLPSLIATEVMKIAKISSLDNGRSGPFAQEMRARYPEAQWRGGKIDDIAVVVCVPVQESGDNDESPIKANT